MTLILVLARSIIILQYWIFSPSVHFIVLSYGSSISMRDYQVSTVYTALSDEKTLSVILMLYFYVSRSSEILNSWKLESFMWNVYCFCFYLDDSSSRYGQAWHYSSVQLTAALSKNDFFYCKDIKIYKVWKGGHIC
jgi:hypothetical protein